MTSDAAILSRLIRPDEDDLPAEAAAAWLGIRFEDRDLDRMHELAGKNQEDRLTPAERSEMENYRRVSFLLDLIHSKARRSLKKSKEARYWSSGWFNPRTQARNRPLRQVNAALPGPTSLRINSQRASATLPFQTPPTGGPPFFF